MMRVKIKMKTGTIVHKTNRDKDDKYIHCRCGYEDEWDEVYGVCPYCGKEK